MKRSFWFLGSVVMAVASSCGASPPGSAASKLLVAHRGASAYAPEHTLAAYRLALQQEADFVEQDLQITRDGELICLHDETLERTTNVEEVFPDRFRERQDVLGTGRAWYARDFDLAELRQLDAGSWFSPEFAGERIPTFAEAITLIRGRAGLFPELKAPSAQREAGLDMETLVVNQLREAGLFEAEADPATPIYLQSFDASSLRRLREEMDCRLPLILLIGTRSAASTSRQALQEIAKFADGIGPDKLLLRRDPSLAHRARELGLRIFPYTFSQQRVDTELGDLAVEMRYFLFNLGVDGLFTDNPDLFPRR